MVIDFHTHCFPDHLAPRAMQKLSNTAGLIPHTDGTKEGLIELMNQDGVDVSVVLSIATNGSQQQAVNDFAASLVGDRLIPFGSVYPHAENAVDEIERIHDLGLKGVKFHPDYQDFFVDDEKMKPIYKAISRLGLVCIFHAGMDYGYAPPYHATPQRLKKALLWLDTPVVAAHWGSQGMGEDTLKLLCGADIYFDMAFGYGTAPKPIHQAILEKHGVDRILFGSDCPWHTPSMELHHLDLLGLTDSEKDMITCGNAKRLLKI